MLSHIEANEQEKAKLEAIKSILLLYSFPFLNFPFLYCESFEHSTGLYPDTFLKN